jgi:hypothetical protein
MSRTTSSNPDLTKLSAIGPPILPSPIKPTVLLSERGVARVGYQPTARMASLSTVTRTELPGWTIQDATISGVLLASHHLRDFRIIQVVGAA